ncbi:FmdB family zinc ribbon protein [Fodinibius salsisoli]|uniref:Zinc ribbon domain-containing protein n=1 Tax=Fodinibius salsisoli TaxID=2820877 RepID=A0ABT3PM37_9BACT|nr:FmdB family zinc ribbon protein [Fodinibius salsisoli]MCW9707011.1 zinc ribbon domain-containing protein [Fodinibius salsisoli]
MPTYEYKREDGTTFEIKQSINDDALEQCPETGQKVKRVISGGGGVVYKGDGWYVTDYKDGDRKEKRAKAADKTNGASTAKKSTDKATAD